LFKSRPAAVLTRSDELADSAATARPGDAGNSAATARAGGAGGSARAGRSAVLAGLRRHAPGTIHVIDPYKVPVEEAVEKAAALTRLDHRVLLIGSTDNPAFDALVPGYVARLRRTTDLNIVLHFPPVPGRGAPICAGADAVLVHTVPNSTDAYFAGQVLADTERALGELDGDRPEVIRSASFAFGIDPKTRQAVASQPTAEHGDALERYLHAVRTGGFDAAYLLSRHGQVSLEVCRLFRERLAAHQLLFVGGGVGSRAQVQRYLDGGADYVVFGSALEVAGWRGALHELAAGT
jgi:heptaprenylglyceryl phosphate synthase